MKACDYRRFLFNFDNKKYLLVFVFCVTLSGFVPVALFGPNKKNGYFSASLGPLLGRKNFNVS